MLWRRNCKTVMSKFASTTSGENSSQVSFAREAFVSAAFRVSQIFPQFLAIRTSPSAWQAFRILLGIFGAALIVLPLSIWNAWLFAPVGLFFFMLAVLLPPVTESADLGRVVKQLHAYSALDGGKFLSPEGPVEIRLLLAKDRIWGLNEKLNPLLVIPAEEFTLVQLTESDDSWLVELGWKQNRAMLLFDSLFAQRRAHAAFSALQRIAKPAAQAQEKPKARAAGA